MFHDGWLIGLTAGGSKEPNYWMNPQISFTVDSNTELMKNSNRSVILSLLQKYNRQKRVAYGISQADEFIKFAVYKVIGGLVKYRQYFEKSKPVSKADLELVGSSGVYLNQREVTGRFSLSAGVYLVIPSCYDSDVEGEFLIRIFTSIY